MWPTRGASNVKITTYLVSIGRLLCLEFLYRWHFLNKISLDWPLTLTTQPSTSNIYDNLVTLPICIEPAVTCHAEQIESTEYSFLLITYWPITNEHKKEFVCFYDQTISSKVIKWALLVNTIWYNNPTNIFQASYAHLICDFILEFKIIIIITFIYYLWW